MRHDDEKRHRDDDVETLCVFSVARDSRKPNKLIHSSFKSIYNEI